MKIKLVGYYDRFLKNSEFADFNLSIILHFTAIGILSSIFRVLGYSNYMSELLITTYGYIISFIVISYMTYKTCPLLFDKFIPLTKTFLIKTGAMKVV